MQLIERTSKKWKALQLLGLVVLCLGLATAIRMDAVVGLVIIVAGLSVRAFGRFFAWWNHG